jgi:small subunit ribosomal protein S2
MRSYIFTQRNGIHIIDLEQTLVLLNKAYEFIRDMVASGEDILIVGTKKQAQESVEQEAQRCGMCYINQRWLGGMLTNFRTIQTRIDYLVQLEDRKEKGDFEILPKKEVLKLEEMITRLNRRLGGVKEMTRIPGAVFIIDPAKEAIAVAECKKMGVPVVATVDTDCNPDVIDHRVPANDDAIKAIRLLCSTVADAVLEGMSLRQGAIEAGGPEVSYPDVVYPEPPETAIDIEDEVTAEIEAEAEPVAEEEAAPEAEAEPVAEEEAVVEEAAPEAEAEPVAEEIASEIEAVVEEHELAVATEEKKAKKRKKGEIVED